MTSLGLEPDRLAGARVLNGNSHLIKNTSHQILAVSRRRLQAVGAIPPIDGKAGVSVRDGIHERKDVLTHERRILVTSRYRPRQQRNFPGQLVRLLIE